MKTRLLILFVFTIAIPLQSFADEIEKNLEPDVPRVSTPMDTVYMTDKDGDVLSSAKLGEQVFFKLPVSNPFASTKEVDYLFHIFDDGEVIFLKPDTILLEGKTSTDVMISWVTSSTGMLDITLEQFHHNTDMNIAPVLQSTIHIQEIILSPLKQSKSGIPIDEIRCKESLTLATRHDGSPACVKPTTKQYLIDQDWAKTKTLDEIQDNPGSIKQNIIDIDYRYVTLYPANMCASINLKLLTEEDAQRYTDDKKDLKDNLILQIMDEDLKEIPDIQELIYATHSIEFPYNTYSSVPLDGMAFVEYEFFLMDKAMKKYGDSQKDYFTKLDKDYEERFANPAKQGFTNHFEASMIVYNDNAYSIDSTNFWISDEHEPISMSVYLRDAIEDDKKFITLTDEDMKFVPKLKEAIENIGTVKESILANKGLPEDQWNEYEKWFKQKSQDRLNVDKFRLMQHDEQVYSVAFSIC